MGYRPIMFAIALPGVAEPGSRPAPVALSVCWWTPYSFLSLKDPVNEESQYMLMKTYGQTRPLILFEKHTGSLAYSALYTVSFSKMYSTWWPLHGDFQVTPCSSSSCNPPSWQIELNPRRASAWTSCPPGAKQLASRSSWGSLPIGCWASCLSWPWDCLLAPPWQAS